MPWRAAAERIQTLSLNDIDLDGSGLDSLSLASIVLGARAARAARVPATGTPRWSAGRRSSTRRDSTSTSTSRPCWPNSTPPGSTSAAPASSPCRCDSSPPADRCSTTTCPLKPGSSTATRPLGRARRSARSTLRPQRGALRRGAVPGLLEFHVARALCRGRPRRSPTSPQGTPDRSPSARLLFSLVDAESYPWEQIDPASIDPRAIIGGTPGELRRRQPVRSNTEFQFTFDPGPGEPTDFPAPTASIELPAGTSLDRSTTFAAARARR